MNANFAASPIHITFNSKYITRLSTLALSFQNTWNKRRKAWNVQFAREESRRVFSSSFTSNLTQVNLLFALQKVYLFWISLDGSQKFQCELCPFLYPSASHLKAHYSRKHRGAAIPEHLKTPKKQASTNTCSICSRNFKNLQELQKHVKAHSGKCFNLKSNSRF